jgi:transposase-like protein
MRSKVAVVVAALDLYFRGLSLRQVAEHLQFTQGVKVSHSTIHNWIKKYVELVNEYVKTLRVNSSGRWLMDDTMVKVSGRHMVLWALLDNETRYLLALHISSKRGADEAQKLIRWGLKTAKTKPSELVSDGLNSYSVAIEREFHANPSQHNMIHIKGPLTAGFNNRMERFHGVLKSRVKTMGKLENEETAKTFAKGFEIYYNFIKPHKALEGKTPAQAVGLTSKKNDWLSLITNADRHIRQIRSNS